MPQNENGEQQVKPVYLVSGGVGASGELLLHTLLAQFPDVHVPVTVCPNVHTVEQIEEIAARAASEQAIVVHTLVDRGRRHLLHAAATTHNVSDVDLVGDLLGKLSQHLAAQPLGKPRLYREFRNTYFKRIEAIEFAVNHDDGQRTFELSKAEIVLLGVSRVGKTPLSVYLSLQGWKVANLPVIPGISLAEELASVDAARVVGLTLAPSQLLLFRRSRQQRLGIGGRAYLDPQHVLEEVRAANHLFSQHGFAVIDVTDKPIEASSEEIIAEVTRRLKTD